MKVKDLIEQLKDYKDFELDTQIQKELTKKELENSDYPYPYDFIPCKLEIVDIGYSDKVVKIHITNGGD